MDLLHAVAHNALAMTVDISKTGYIEESNTKTD